MLSRKGCFRQQSALSLSLGDDADSKEGIFPLHSVEADGSILHKYPPARIGSPAFNVDVVMR